MTSSVLGSDALSAKSTVPLLEAHELTVRFGGLVAVDAVSVHFPAGELVGIIGPNGAGKTTFFNAISGVTEPHRQRSAPLCRQRPGAYLPDASRVH